MLNNMDMSKTLGHTGKAIWRGAQTIGLSLAVSASTLALSAGAWAQNAAQKVNDLPGGPAVNQLNLHPPVTKIAEAQHGLHWFMMAICTIIFLAVFGVMFYSVFKHRKSKGAKSANFHESTAVEIAWTVVPFLIVIAMALPATKVLVAQKDTTAADLTIKVTGYQWKWGYDYIKGEGEGIGFISTLDNSHRVASNSGRPAAMDNYLLKVDNPLVVPKGKKVRIITTANDVIHAFMVPAFGIKQDAIPGFVRDTWFRAEQTGDFYGQCAELCGKEHAYMPIHVKVMEPADYSKWVDEQKKAALAKADDPNKVWDLPGLIARGEKVYSANCVACHGTNGAGNAATGIKALVGSAVVLSDDKSKQVNVLLKGQGQAMASFATLSDTELAAVITYTKNNWSNQTGQFIQPTEIAAARK
jgi:cytochrome c oxidase subunit II